LSLTWPIAGRHSAGHQLKKEEEERKKKEKKENIKNNFNFDFYIKKTFL